YQPEDDYAALVTRIPGRRVDTKEPLKSLVLLKPTMSVEHGGGPRFKKYSAEYKALLTWIEAGAPYGDRDAPVITQLLVSPGYRVLQNMNEKQPLNVTIVYSDGKREDVTSRAIFSSNDESVLKVDRAGVVTLGGANGDAAIMVRYAGQFAAAVLGATLLPAPKSFPAPSANLIDHEISAKLQDLHIVPSAACTDAEFIRRLYLDLLGVLPSAAEVKLFIGSTAPHKRADLIDQVLERPEYADLQALL